MQGIIPPDLKFWHLKETLFPNYVSDIIKGRDLWKFFYINHVRVMQRIFVLNTAWNAVISPNFLVWEFCGKAQFPHQKIRRNHGILRSEILSSKATFYFQLALKVLQLAVYFSICTFCNSCILFAKFQLATHNSQIFYLKWATCNTQFAYSTTQLAVLFS